VARRGRRRRSLPVLWRIPDDLWELIRVTLPAVELRPSGGRPWIAPRRIVDGVLFVLRTGCQWKAVPREFGSGSTVHRRFQRWTDEGRWKAMWRLLLQYAEATQQLEWVWQSADASLHKAPLGGEKTGPNPTDRAKSGTKRHVLTDGGGVPALGRGAHPLLVQPLSQAAHPVGEETAELPCARPVRRHADRVAACGLGS